MTKKILFLLPALVLWQTTICARICPYNFLPKDWVQSYQVGKVWTKLLLKVYTASFSKSQKEAEQDTGTDNASKATAPAGVPMTKSTMHSREMIAHTVTILKEDDPCPQTAIALKARQRIEVSIVRKAT